LREEKKARDTWANDIINKKYDDLDYFMYTSSNDGGSYIDYENKVIRVSCDDTLNGTFEKTSKAIQLLRDENVLENYDFVFRTNTSTYVNVSLLNEFINSDMIDNDLVYGGDIYCARTACGPYNYSYYAVGNSILIPVKYTTLLTQDTLDFCYNNFYNVNPNRKDILNIDDNAIGFILNCFFEYEKNVYHKLMYRVFGNNKEGFEQVNKYITSPIRIYKGDREEEFKIYDMIHSHYNESKDLDFIRQIISPSLNNYMMFYS
jgi:hypothetical protein